MKPNDKNAALPVAERPFRVLIIAGSGRMPRYRQQSPQAYAPLVWQCRYGGIEVPEYLWEYTDSGIGKKYSGNQTEDVIHDNEYMCRFENWVKKIEEFVSAKGKVQPGKYRAYGYKPLPHLWNEIKNGLRALKLRFGKAPANSSPEKQIALNLNRNATLHPKRTEGEKLRK